MEPRGCELARARFFCDQNKQWPKQVMASSASSAHNCDQQVRLFSGKQITRIMVMRE